MIIKEIRTRLQKLGDRQKARFLQGFFKTGPGEYGDGDIFLGIRVPQLRKLVNEYKTLPAPEVLPLLRSLIHEERLLALLILVRAYAQGDDPARKQIYGMYLENTRYINNWDLVDVSAPQIVGAFLIDGSRKPLYRLAKSKNLWERRIAVMATFHFIRCRQFSDTLKISKLLLADKEDLIHKAVGWMLREVGKRDLQSEEDFLKKHCRQMPRTMLRYAIEKFSPSKRRMYLEGTV
jgi:3-methyladenine DNA glycosylase AlkD